VDYPDVNDLYNDGFGGLAVLAVVFIVMLSLLMAAVWYAVTSWLLGRVFKKAGIDQWKAWVPFYNSWVFLELGGQQGWLALLVLIPGVGGIVTLVFLCIAAYNIGLAFGKSGGWVVLYLLLSWVWYAIVGFDSSRWEPWRQPAKPLYGANVPPPPEAAV